MTLLINNYLKPNNFKIHIKINENGKEHCLDLPTILKYHEIDDFITRLLGEITKSEELNGKIKIEFLKPRELKIARSDKTFYISIKGYYEKAE